MIRSANFAHALDAWRQIRADFEIAREAAYDRAVEATNGALLNRRGLHAGIDSYSLFIGPDTRARAYASRELLDHWARFPRVTFEEFERQSLEALR